MKASAATDGAIKPWYGYLESQLRKLVERLEMDEMVGLEIAQPCVKTFGPISIPGAGTCVLCEFLAGACVSRR